MNQPSCVCQSLSRARLFAMPWTAAHQSPLSMKFSRQRFWSGLPYSLPSDGRVLKSPTIIVFLFAILFCVFCLMQFDNLVSCVKKLLPLYHYVMPFVVYYNFPCFEVCYKIKRHFPFGRKAVTNFDSVLKSRDITLLTKVHLVKAMVFPVVVYGCESWAIKLSTEELILLNCGIGVNS